MSLFVEDDIIEKGFKNNCIAPFLTGAWIMRAPRVIRWKLNRIVRYLDAAFSLAFIRTITEPGTAIRNFMAVIKAVTSLKNSNYHKCLFSKYIYIFW